MASGRATPKKIEVTERRYKALNLKKAGLQYPAIAALLAGEYGGKYDRRRAFDDVKAVLKDYAEQTAHAAEELRTLELERLDSYLLALAPKTQQGDARAIQTALQVSDRRCKLLGLDAPIQVKIQEGIEAGLESEISQFLNTLEARLDSATLLKVLEAIQPQADPIASD